MQKILLILICMFIGAAHATEMCAKNNTIVVPLDATVVAESGKTGSNAVEWMWWATFSYGKIYGTATCLSKAEVAELLPSDDDELLGRSGKDATAQSKGTADNRGECYCKLTHPMSSRWVFNFSNSAAYCASSCAHYCANPVGNPVGLRSGLFNAIGASMAEKEPETDTE